MAQQPPVSKEELNDLFQDESVVPAAPWQTFKSVGDSLQGTLIEEPILGVNAKYGNRQITYTLQTKEGDVIMFGLNPDTNVLATRQLKQADIGDEVGIKLKGWYIASLGKEVNDEELLKLNPAPDGKVNGKYPGKNFDIRVRHNGNRPQVEAEPFPGKTPGMERTSPVQTVPAGVLTPEQKLARIIEIAKAKLAAVSDDDAKAKVMEITKIPLIQSRFDDILSVMEAMAKV